MNSSMLIAQVNGVASEGAWARVFGVVLVRWPRSRCSGCTARPRLLGLYPESYEAAQHLLG